MHENAAGCSIPARAKADFLKFSNNDLPDNAFDKCYQVDYIFDANDAALSTVGSILASRPDCFGNGIDEVKVAIENISLANILAMGADKSSMKITQNGVSYIRFKDADFVESIMDNRTKKLNVIARFNLNEFNGKTSLQCFIDDYEFAGQDDSRFDF